MGPAAQVALGVEQLGIKLGAHPEKLRVIALEVADEVLVLFRPKSAGGVDEPASGREVHKRSLEQSALSGGQGGEGRRVEAPTQVGPTSQRAELGAGGVDEDAGDTKSGRQRPAVDVDAGGSGAGGAGPKPFEASEICIRGVHPAPVSQLSGELQGLAPGTCAEVEDFVIGLGGDELAQQLASFVLHFEERFVPGSQAVEVGAMGGDDQAVGGKLSGNGLNPFVGEPRRQGIAGDAGGVGAQTDGAWDVERVAEGFGVVAGGAKNDFREPIGKREAVGKSFRFGVAGNQSVQSLESASRSESSTPEADSENGLGDRGALICGRVAVLAQELVEDAVGGFACEHIVECGAQRVLEADQRGPGDGMEALEALHVGSRARETLARAAASRRVRKKSLRKIVGDARSRLRKPRRPSA